MDSVYAPVKQALCLALYIVVASGGLGCRKGPESTAASARDAATRPVPRRVITLTPSTTEVVYALGAGELLVGVDQYSTYPEAAKALPKVGDFLSPNLEAMLALAPDIILADESQSKLNHSGLNFLFVRMQTVEDVRQALRTIGDALGRKDAADAQIAKLDASLRTAEEKAAAAAKKAEGQRPRVLFVVDRRPGGLAGMVAAGPGTYIDDLLRRAGVVNVLADAPVRYVQISPEEILARAPDIILDAVHADDPGKAQGDWAILASVPAVKSGRVHVLGDPLFVTPGPRLDEAFTRLVDILW